jgi:hypothetical protein
LSKCGKAKTISDLNSAERKEHGREEYRLKTPRLPPWDFSKFFLQAQKKAIGKGN